MNWHLLNPFNDDFGTHDPIKLQRAEGLILIYWGVSLALGIPFLYDWLLAWAVPLTWSNPWLLGLLLGTLLLSQVLYIMVSHPEDRPISWGASWLFAICNGVAETLAFALVFRGGMVLGGWLMSLAVPAWANGAGLALGLIFFVLYGGAIHGLFWIRLLPPHFHNDPLSLRIRKLRPLSETLLVLGWSLTWWLYGDLWTVVLFHTIIDLTLMLQVRPPLFQGRRAVPDTVMLAGPPPEPLRRIYGLNMAVSDNTLHTWSVTTGVLGHGAVALLGFVFREQRTGDRG